MDIRKMSDVELAEAVKEDFLRLNKESYLFTDIAQFIRLCVKDSTPKRLTQQEIIREMWEVDCRKILGTPENVHQVKLSAYATAIHAAQERKGKDTNATVA